MTLDEYKELILHQLEKADDCEEVELIITRSLQLMHDRHLPKDIIKYYLHQLHDSLEEHSPNDFDSVHWCNIKWAMISLKKLTGK